MKRFDQHKALLIALLILLHLPIPIHKCLPQLGP